jgi:hypothetical protein
MKTSELRGKALDWAVAEAEGFFKKDMASIRDGKVDVFYFDGYEPSNDWALGGAIIERECINIVKNETGKYWQAASEKWMLNDGHPSIGETPLIAAMRCYVESELGDEVQLPEELSNEQQ